MNEYIRLIIYYAYIKFVHIKACEKNNKKSYK